MNTDNADSKNLFLVTPGKSKRTHIALVVLLIAALAISASHVFAECLACNELRGVRIEMKNGSEITGYVHWNASWFTEQWRNRFPQSLIEPAAREDQRTDLIIYTKLLPVPGNRNRTVTTKSNQVELTQGEIAGIASAEMPFEGRDGTGGVPIVSEKAFELLESAKPVAIAAKPEEVLGMCTFHFISFEPSIGKKKLETIAKEIASTSKGREERLKQLEQQRIVALLFCSD